MLLCFCNCSYSFVLFSSLMLERSMEQDGTLQVYYFHTCDSGDKEMFDCLVIQ